jgi:hypothetical protein
MPVTPTYPGVYIQEVPSGVRTIAGVSTSVALFIGRATQGVLNSPQLCLSYSDFERIFTSEYAGSDLVRAVRLFFQNGGTQCYVMRVANGAVAAQVTLANESGTDVLTVTAKSPGLRGDSIRMAVTYRGLSPESTFEVELFQWTRNNQGDNVKSNVEVFTALSMDPAAARYAPDVVNANSNLVSLTDLNAPPAAEGFSQAGRPVPSPDDATFRTEWMNLIGAASVNGANQFRLSVDGHSFVNINLSGLDFTVAPLDTDANARANLAGEIQTIVNNALLGGAVTVSMEVPPNAPTDSVLLRIASAAGDVRIEPAASNDLAAALMLGSAQGGLEVSRFAANRPAPTGLVFDRAQLASFADQAQTAFNTFTVDGVTVALGNSLQTAPAPAPMYRDGYSSAVTGHSDGLREKWAILAAALNDTRANDPTFAWAAEVWGQRLAILPTAGDDNSQGSVTTGGADGVDIGSDFGGNVRYYSLGTSGQGASQSGGVAGNDGNAPTLGDYQNAYTVADREIDLFNLLLLPKDSAHDEATTRSLWGPASIFCQQRRAFLIMDAPLWKTVQEATHPQTGVNSLRVGLVKDHSAIFYPRLIIRENGRQEKVGPAGAVAGLMARVDSSRGVWKAPAGTEADLRGIVGIEQRFSDGENGVLNPRAVNTIRVFPNGIVNWGARTMDGDNDFGSEYKYIPIRRLALFMEESLYRGLKWVVFEPNDEPLWSQIRLNVGAFMHGLFRQGAFQGATPREAYFVKCDSETTTQADRNLGIVNIIVGFAPLKPAEFVILSLQQIAGQIEV